MLPRGIVLLAVLSTGCGNGGFEGIVTAELEYTIRAQPGTAQMTFTLLLPPDLLGSQEVRDIRITPEPVRVFEESGNRYAEFLFPEVPEVLRILVEAPVRLASRDLESSVGGGGARKVLMSGDRARYLTVERKLEHDQPEIRALATRIEGTDREARLRSGLELVCGAVEYSGYLEEDRGALETLRVGTGDCNDYADLFVSVLRADGIPARVVCGVLASGRGEAHSWVEAWVDHLGWIALDPLQVDLGQATFESLPGTYLALTTERSDDRISPWFYFSWNCEQGKAEISWESRVQ